MRNTILTTYEFMDYVQHTLQERWKNIIPTVNVQVVLNLINQDPVQPKGSVLLKDSNSSVLEIPFLYKDSKLVTANSLIYSMNSVIEDYIRNESALV